MVLVHRTYRSRLRPARARRHHHHGPSTSRLQAQFDIILLYFCLPIHTVPRDPTPRVSIAARVRLCRRPVRQVPPRVHPNLRLALPQPVNLFLRPPTAPMYKKKPRILLAKPRNESQRPVGAQCQTESRGPKPARICRPGPIPISSLPS